MTETYPHKGDLSWLKEQIQTALNRNVQQDPGPPGELLPPGAVVAVKMNDREDPMLFHGGYDDPIAGTPIKADALFEIGSVTKTVTSTAILKYQQTPGFDINLDETLEFFLARVTEWHGINPEATLRQALQHTAGTGEYPNTLSSAAPFRGYPETRERHSNFPSATFLGHAPEHETPVVHEEGKGTKVWQPYQVVGLLGDLAFPEPGSKWQYSNGNFLLAGMIWLELTEGHVLHASVEELFKQPLGLKDFYYPSSEAFDVDRLSVAWKKTHKLQPHIRTAYYTSYGTAGGFVSTPHDLACFIHALFSGDRLLGQKAKAEMQDFRPMESPLPPVPGFKWVGYGLGTIQYQYQGPGGNWVDVVGHGGATSFFLTNATYVPVLDKTVCIHFNQGLDDPKLLQTLFGLTRDVITALWQYDPPVE